MGRSKAKGAEPRKRNGAPSTGAVAAPKEPDYRYLTIAEKQRRAEESGREPAMPCPKCEAQVMPRDLPRHLEATCPGKRATHPLARWITWAQVMALGVPKGTIARWIGRGRVATRGEVGERTYLERDIVKLIALAGRRVRGRRVPKTEPTRRGHGD